jgi:hypothetical protein
MDESGTSLNESGDQMYCSLADVNFLAAISNSTITWTYTPYATQILSRSCLEDLYIKTMTDTVRRRGDTSYAGSNDSDLRSVELGVRRRRRRRQQLVEKPLNDLVEKDKRM